MLILLTGGGTLGSVTPLLAIVEAWRARDESVEFVWIGTQNGPERKLVEEEYAIRFYQIPVARFPRYVSIEWLFLPFRFFFALLKCASIIQKEKPDSIIGAGGFTQVPTIFAAQFFNIKCFALQIDVQYLLSTKLVTPFVKRLFFAWGDKAVGVPVRHSLLNGLKEKSDKLNVLVFGGGTGAEWLNEKIFEIAPRLCKEANVLHLTGIGKRGELAKIDGYIVRESLGKEMADAYATADLIVARAGMGTIAELSALRKPAILIPIPNSAQEKNTEVIRDAVRILNQDETNSEALLNEICLLLNDSIARAQYASRIGSVLRTNVADGIIDEVVAE